MHAKLAALVIAAIVAATPLPRSPAWGHEVVPGSASEITLSFAPLVRRVAPAVVNIHPVQAERAARRPTVLDPPRFFARRRRGGAAAFGSGVIVSSSGLVITNAHVVADMRAIRVGLNDRREYPATLLLADPRTDLAVVQIEAEATFPHVELGDAEALAVGDLVLAIGNPFGVGQTVTQGIVSAIDRTAVGRRGRPGEGQLFIQTDAAINPGNSGGALIDMSGRLVGINTAIYSRSGGSNGIGFAIPIDMVRIVLQSARDGKAVRRAWFGARLETVDGALARQAGLDRRGGAVVIEVLPDSPARRAGLKVGDVIVALDARRVTDRDAFGYLFATRGTEGEAVLEVIRDGLARTASVRLEPPPEDPPRDARRIEGRSPLAGALALNLSPALAEELNMDLDESGVVLTRVEQGSPAGRLGLQARDKVLLVNGWRIADTASLVRALATEEAWWDIVIEREGRPISLTLGG